MTAVLARRICPRPGCSETLAPGEPCGAHASRPSEARPSASRRGYGKDWRAGLRAEVLEQEPKCQGWGAPYAHAATDTADHTLRQGDWGGQDQRRNLRGLCHSCHSRKTLAEQRLDRVLRSSVPLDEMAAAVWRFLDGGGPEFSEAWCSRVLEGSPGRDSLADRLASAVMRGTVLWG